MQQVNAIAEMQLLLQQTKCAGKTIGLMYVGKQPYRAPIQLLTLMRSVCDVLVVSLSGVENRDTTKWLDADADILFHFEKSTPTNTRQLRIAIEGIDRTMQSVVETKIIEQDLTELLKLIHIIQPDKLLLLETGFFFRALVERMLKDLCIGTQIVHCPTIRETDGLAISQNNMLLSPLERAKAPIIHRALLQAQRTLSEGERDADLIREIIRDHVQTIQFASVDAVVVMDTSTLQQVSVISGSVEIVVLVRFGKTVLEDGFRFQEEDFPAYTW